MHLIIAKGPGLIAPVLMTATTNIIHTGNNISMQACHFSSESLLLEEEDDMDLNEHFHATDAPTCDGMNQVDEENLMASISFLMEDGDTSADKVFFSLDFDTEEQTEETLYEQDRQEYIWYENFSLLKKISKQLSTVVETPEEE